MSQLPIESQPLASGVQPASLKSDTTSVPFESGNPFQGPGAEEAWQRLLAELGKRVSREEALRHMIEKAKK